MTLEIPAGKCEVAEAPLVTAQRELNEEAGLAADHWQPLTTFISLLASVMPKSVCSWPPSSDRWRRSDRWIKANFGCALADTSRGTSSAATRINL